MPPDYYDWHTWLPFASIIAAALILVGLATLLAYRLTRALIRGDQRVRAQGIKRTGKNIASSVERLDAITKYERFSRMGAALCVGLLWLLVAMPTFLLLGPILQLVMPVAALVIAIALIYYLLARPTYRQELAAEHAAETASDESQARKS